jgi:aminoglycoside/choline kinase family phosphotransferase
MVKCTGYNDNVETDLNSKGVSMESAIKSNQTSLNEWVTAYFGKTAIEFVPITGDASFKAFYRLTHEHKNYMLMAAPPAKEKVVEFFEVDKLLIQRGVNAPKILAVDLAQVIFNGRFWGHTLLFSFITK